MQQAQVLLRSDHFCLFAGIGPLAEGYIILAPHACDWKVGGLRTFAEAPTELLDELVFLRGIVTQFYRAVYRIDGAVCFEHGRAGTCGVSETKHCYHAHLCCFPVAATIRKDMKVPGKRVVRGESLSELGAIIGKRPYLLVQELAMINSSPTGTARNESWINYVLVLEKETDIERQYLRKLLAKSLGKDGCWDWAIAPGIAEVQSLCRKFHAWLQSAGLPIMTRKDLIPRIAFLDSVRAYNSLAYDAIASEYHRTWRTLAPSMIEVVGDFCGHLKQSRRQLSNQRPCVLDAGCGTGIHVEAFYEAGFDCVGVDRSRQMLEIARRRFTNSTSTASAPQLQFKIADAFDLRSFKDGSFDAIWYSAIMVHLPRRFAQSTINRLYRLLKPGGIVYLSAQTGRDAVFRNERRFFVYYSETELEAHFRAAGFTVLKRWHDTTNKGACGDRRTKYWLNYFLEKM